MHWRRKWQPTPVFLPGESQGRGSLVSTVYGVAQSWTQLKRLSSSSSNSLILSSRGFINLFHLKLLLYLKLLCIYEAGVKLKILFHTDIQLTQYHLLKRPFFPILLVLSYTKCTYKHGTVYGLSTGFNWSLFKNPSASIITHCIHYSFLLSLDVG